MGLLVLTIVGSILAIIIVMVCERHFHIISCRWRCRQYRKKFSNRLMNEGVTNFHFSRSDFSKYRDGSTLEEYLRNANRTIKIIALWMAGSIEMEGITAGLEKILGDDDFVIMKIALINPDSEIINPLSKLLDMEENEMREKIRSSIQNLRLLRARLNTTLKQKFKLSVYDSLPIASVIMIDDGEKQGRIQFDFKIYCAPRSNSFGFELTNTKSDFYTLCKEKYNLLLDESIEVEE